MVKRYFTALMCLLALTVSGGQAVADGGLLPLRTDADGLKPADAKSIDAAIGAKLALYPDLTLLPAPEGDITDMMLDLECIDLDGDCLARIGEKSGAGRVLYVGVARKGTALRGTLRWVDVAAKKITDTDEVDGKNPKALGDALALLLEKRLGAPPAPVKPPEVVVPKEDVKPPAAPPGTLIIETNRIQAQIFIDQEYAGTGTATIERPAGRYTLRLTHPGDETQVIEVDIASGQTATRQVALKSNTFTGKGDPTKPPPQADDGGSDWVIWVIIGAVVVAGAATAIGFAASGDDPKPSGTLLLGLDPSGAWRDPVTRGGRR